MRLGIGLKVEFILVIECLNLCFVVLLFGLVFSCMWFEVDFFSILCIVEFELLVMIKVLSFFNQPTPGLAHTVVCTVKIYRVGPHCSLHC